MSATPSIVQKETALTTHLYPSIRILPVKRKRNSTLAPPQGEEPLEEAPQAAPRLDGARLPGRGGEIIMITIRLVIVVIIMIMIMIILVVVMTIVIVMIILIIILIMIIM